MSEKRQLDDWTPRKRPPLSTYLARARRLIDSRKTTPHPAVAIVVQTPQLLVGLETRFRQVRDAQRRHGLWLEARRRFWRYEADCAPDDPQSLYRRLCAFDSRPATSAVLVLPGSGPRIVRVSSPPRPGTSGQASRPGLPAPTGACSPGEGPSALAGSKQPLLGGASPADRPNIRNQACGCLATKPAPSPAQGLPAPLPQKGPERGSSR